MSRLWHTGAEWQAASTQELGSVSGALAIDTSIKASGAASYKVSGNITADNVIEGEFPSFTQIGGGSQQHIFFRGKVYIDALTDDELVRAYLSFITPTGPNQFSIQFYNSGGTLHLEVSYNDFATTPLDTTTGVAFDTWMLIEAEWDSGPANGSEVLRIKLDGSTILELTNLNYTIKNTLLFNFGVYNGTASTISDEIVYFDDLAINNASGSVNNSWIGEGSIVIAVPTGAGDNAATAGTASSINEVPVTDTATSSANRIELDTTTSIGDYAITDSSTLGIGSSDTINAISVVARVREEAAGTSNYTLRIKSAASGTVQATSSVDAGNATARTNPSSTTAFGRPLISETDPDTAAAWTPTGTNSLDNAQIGAATTDGTPDIWVTAMAAMVDYIPSEAAFYQQSLPATSVGVAVLSKFAIYPKSLSASSVGAAVLSKVLKYKKSLTATMTGVAVLAKTLLLKKSLSAAMSGQAVLSRVAIYYRALSATMEGVASLTKGLVYPRTLEATSVGVVSLNKVLIYGKSLTATSVGIASLTFKSLYYRTLSATSTGLAVLSKVLLLKKTLAAVSVGIASLSRLVNYFRALSATMSGVVSLTAQKTYQKTLAAVSSGVASLTRLAKRYRTLAISAVGVVSLTRIASRFKTLAVTAVGVPSLALGNIYYRTLAVISVGVPSLTTLKTFYRTLSATVTGVASLSMLKSFYRTLSAQVIAVASLSKTATYFRTLSATFTGVATLSIKKTFYRVLSATAVGVAILEKVVTIGGAVRVFIGRIIHMAVGSKASTLGDNTKDVRMEPGSDNIIMTDSDKDISLTDDTKETDWDH